VCGMGVAFIVASASSRDGAVAGKNHLPVPGTDGQLEFAGRTIPRSSQVAHKHFSRLEDRFLALLVTACANPMRWFATSGTVQRLGESCRHRKYRVLIGDHVKSVAEV
jgi:hypothetical protein